MVEIKVGYHIRLGVQNHLKLFHAISLCKGGSHGLKIKIQTDIRCERRDIDGRSACRVRTGIGYRRTDRLRIYNLWLRYNNCW